MKQIAKTIDLSDYQGQIGKIRQIFKWIEEKIDGVCELLTTQKQLDCTHKSFGKLKFEGMEWDVCNDCGISKDDIATPHECNQSCFPLKESIVKYGIGNLVYNTDNIKSFIDVDNDKHNGLFALVFDGNGLYDYLSDQSDYRNIFNSHWQEWDALMKKLDLIGETYHSWNLVFYRR